MTIQVTGKNLEAGDAYTGYVMDKVREALEKYIGENIAGHIRLEKERGRFRTTCSIRLRSGLLLEAQGGGGDAYASADTAVERLEKRVRRHKRRLKSHHHGVRQREVIFESEGRDYTVELDEGHDDAADHAGPVIVAETEFRLRELSVGEAVMQLDLTDAKFLVFRNAGNGATNIVYRRDDGNIGWIDPGGAGAADLEGGRGGNSERM